MPLRRGEVGAHGDLARVLGHAERVVVGVGLQIADVVVGEHVRHRRSALHRRVHPLHGSVLALVLGVGAAPDRSRGGQRVLQNDRLCGGNEAGNVQRRRRR